MRYVRRLPPLLRVASLVGLLFLLAGFGLFINSIIMAMLSPPRDMYQGLRRGMEIGGNLFALGMACFYAARIYTNRFRRPDRRPFPLGSWQSQVRVIALLSALPLAGIALALIISPAAGASWIV